MAAGIRVRIGLKVGVGAGVFVVFGVAVGVAVKVGVLVEIGPGVNVGGGVEVGSDREHGAPNMASRVTRPRINQRVRSVSFSSNPGRRFQAVGLQYPQSPQRRALYLRFEAMSNPALIPDLTMKI